MKIGIDCRLAGKKHAGIGRYIENVIIRLPLSNSDINWVYFFHDQKQADEILKKITQTHHSKIKVVFAPIRHYSLAEQLKLPKLFKKEKLDLLYVPHFNVPISYKGKLVVTIHDLLWHERKGLHVTTLNPLIYWLKYLAYRFVAKMAIKKASKIFVPAQTIQEAITKYYPLAENKVVVTYEGISEEFVKANQKLTSEKLKKLNQRRSQMETKQLVYVGSLYPHKNVNLVIKALKNLPEFILKIVGSRSIFQDQTKEFVKKMGLEKQVKFAGYLTDVELIKEFENSYALVQPSLSEGFGLTGVEAMACGLPVIASDIKIFKEIYGKSAHYFDPNDIQSFVKVVQNINSHINNLKEKYSWTKVASQILAECSKI